MEVFLNRIQNSCYIDVAYTLSELYNDMPRFNRILSESLQFQEATVDDINGKIFFENVEVDYEGLSPFIDISTSNIVTDIFQLKHRYCPVEYLVLGDDIYNKVVELDSITYYKNYVIHRDSSEGPAMIINHGDIVYTKYYRNGMIHRDEKEGPAVVCYNKDKLVYEIYIENGKIQRNDGPAMTFFKSSS